MEYLRIILNLAFVLVAMHTTKIEAVPFNDTWLPLVKILTSINSSSIQLVWQPSLSLDGVDIDKLNGTFTVTLYVGGRLGEFSSTTIYDIGRLNSTGVITIAELTPDTVYHACFRTKWHAPNTTIETKAYRVIPPPSCQLLRTFATDETTQNPVPPVGNYSWEQILTSNGTVAIVINASVSSELPYRKRDISVRLGSTSKSKTIQVPVEHAEFVFDQLESNTTSYSMLMIVTLTDGNVDRTFSNVLSATINIKRNNGHREFLSNFLLLLLLTLSAIYHKL